MKTWAVVFFVFVLLALFLIYSSSAESFDNYLYLYRVEDNLYGYKSMDKNDAIKPQWNLAYPFYQGTAVVGIEGNNAFLENGLLYGLINTKGEYIIEPILEYIVLEDYVCGTGQYYFFTTTDGRGFYDLTNNALLVLSGTANTYGPRQSGQLIAVQDYQTYKWGFVDWSGSLVIQCIYDEAMSFENGYGYVGSFDGEHMHYDLIDENGIAVKRPNDTEAYDYMRNGLCIIWKPDEEGGLYGISDAEGNIVVEPQYRMLFPFSDSGEYNLYIYKNSRNKWGCINSEGEIVLPAVFDSIASQNSLIGMNPLTAYVKFEEQFYYINFENRSITPKKVWEHSY